jgi:predicted aspartyl protease
MASAFGRTRCGCPFGKLGAASFFVGAISAALLLFAAGAASAAVDDEPSGLVASSASLAHVRTLYDRAHAHDYTRAATVIEEWRLFQDDTVGSYHVNRLGKDVRETTTLGPLVYQRGVRGAVHWEQNRNGIVYTYPGDHEARDAVSERAFRDAGDERDVKLVGESVALNAYVVEVNPPAGRHEWLFVDKRTGYVARREYVERRRRYATSYDDYKLVEGIPEPSRTRTVDSLGNEREQILVTRSLDTTPDLRDVDIPAPRRVVEFPEKQPSVRLPVRFVNGLAIVRVIVGRVGYDFLLDSGAAGIVIDPSVAQQQGLERYGQRLGATLGTFPESTTIVPQMTIGGLRMRNVVSRVVTVPFRPDDHTHVAGLLGFDFFADAVVHIDLQHNLAEAISPDRFRAPADAVTVNVDLDDKTPAVTAHAGSTTGRVVLDTGANRTVFETAFAERGDFSPDRVASTMHVRGMGGYASAEPTRVPSFELGGLWLRDATADVSNADLGTEDVDGIIGTDLLRSYELWFDYRANAVYVRREKR